MFGAFGIKPPEHTHGRGKGTASEVPPHKEGENWTARKVQMRNPEVAGAARYDTKKRPPAPSQVLSLAGNTRARESIIPSRGA